MNRSTHSTPLCAALAFRRQSYFPLQSPSARRSSTRPTPPIASVAGSFQGDLTSPSAAYDRTRSQLSTYSTHSPESTSLNDSSPCVPATTSSEPVRRQVNFGTISASPYATPPKPTLLSLAATVIRHPRLEFRSNLTLSATFPRPPRLPPRR
jgi:hypothetical protein